MYKRLAVLISGTGTLLEAMIKDGLPIQMVLADRLCRGIDIAEKAGIKVAMAGRKGYGYTPGAKTFDREAFTADIADVLVRERIDIVAMAGFNTRFSASIFVPYRDRILNSHPSLLPAFKGERAVRDALEFGVKVTGTTIHIATEELDHGPILAQVPVLVMPGDTEETLWERIKEVERPLYPEVIRKFAASLK